MAEQHYSPIVTNFNGGEISARMQGRTDTAIYPIALAEMINFAPSVEGPAVKCPGFRYIRASAASSTWLSTFVRTRTQAYVIEWSDGEEEGGVLRFFTNGGRIETAPNVPYEVAVPYSAAEAPYVAAQQSYDRLYLAHRAHALASLLRTTPETFEYDPVELEGGPFADMNRDEAVTVAFSASSGAVTGYATGGPVWLETDAGSLFLVETRDYAEIPQWMSGIKVADGQLRSSDGKVYLKIGGAEHNGNVQPTHSEGAAWDGDGATGGTDANDKGPYGSQWLYVHDRFGIVRIDSVTSAFEIEGTVLRRLPNSAALANSYDHPIGYTPPYSGGTGGFYPRFELIDGEYVPVEPGEGDFDPPDTGTGYSFPGTWRWAHAALSDTAGWPVAVVLAWGRLVVFTDFEIIGSTIADYGGGRANFSEYDESGVATADMSFRRRLSIANPVLWAREDRGNIVLGTADGPYLVGPINPSQIVSAENIQAVKQTRHGCAQVQPAEIGGATIFVQAGGAKLRAAEYSFQVDRYQAANLTIWSRHILRPGCIQLAHEAESEELLWCLRSDGVMAAHPHEAEQEVKGFSRRIHAAGPVLSTVCIPSEDGTIDEQWALVEDSETGAKSIEQRAPWWVDGGAAADAFFVDSGATVTDPASLTLTGIDWLAGQDVDVLCDGAVLRGLAVTAGGVLQLPAMALPAKVTFGRKIRASFKTLRPELRDGRGNTVQTKMQRLFNLALRLLDSWGVKVAAKPGVEDDMIKRGADVPMGEGAGYFSGDTVPKEVGGNWDRHGQFELVSDDPVPCIVVAAVPRIAVTE